MSRPPVVPSSSGRSELPSVASLDGLRGRNDRSAESAPVTLAERWGGRSRIGDLDGPVHWVDFGPTTGSGDVEAPLVLVHGLGGSHLNWVQVAPALAEIRRVIAIDLAGFGLTPGAGRDLSVRANAALLGRFIREELGGRSVLVGNSMGGMVSLLLAAAEPDVVAGLVLVDPSVPSGVKNLDRMVAASSGSTRPQSWASSSSSACVGASPPTRGSGMIQLCFADYSRAAGGDGGGRLAPALSRHLVSVRGGVPPGGQVPARRAAPWPHVLRSHPPHLGSVLLIHGEQDRLVPSMRRGASRMASPIGRPSG